jgi:hypothetical protein
MTRRARGVDDEGRRRRIETRDVFGQFFGLPCCRFTAAFHDLVEGNERPMLVHEHRRGIDHHDMADVGQVIQQGQDLVDIFLVLGDEDDRAAVAHLVIHLRGRCRRIYTVGHGAKREGGHVGQHPFLAGIAHDGDPFARFEA